MSPLFRKSEEKVAREAAVQAEIDRLKALSVDDLAVMLLPALGPEIAGRGHTVREQQLCNYLLRDFPRVGTMKALQLLPRVRKSLERLKDADLVSSLSIQRSPIWQITGPGETALAQGTIEQRVRRDG
jgi:hypothetical protein